ncbi:GNAT family N-acetyltransferase [Asticcacaulis sp. AND118]|uniref:GNAT family N-acetyltransferase n=1 Tax=Asticcacaulis sp. AND118 TaxID=2840468 RepID=UPI001CFF73B5|nr:GNAT family N-acetyltransferase [Asticcacaulis sp. AND118]UDF04169.1 acetyltransferase [Asticcacaulis sp. AND118]
MISFRPLTDNDAGRLLLWMSSPHVRQWWVNEGQTAEDAVEDALAYIGAANATAWLFEWNGKPAGYTQSYECHPDHEPGSPCHSDSPKGTFLIDMFIGDASLLGEGIGTQVLTQISNGMFKKGALCVRVAPQTANLAAMRCCEKAGFVSVGLTPCGGLALMQRTPELNA